MKFVISTPRLLLYFLFLFSTAGFCEAQKNKAITYAGIAETNLLKRDFEEQPSCIIRNMFKKTEADWNISTDTLQSLQWSILYNGKKLTSVGGTLYYPQDTGFLLRDIFYAIPCGSLPHIGKKSRIYSGWPDEPTFRPLVVSTNKLAVRFQLKKYNAPTAAIRLVSDYIWNRLKEDSLLSYVYNGINEDGFINHSISRDSLISRVNNVYAFGNNGMFICADLNISMETIRQKRPFEDLRNSSLSWDIMSEDGMHEFTKNAWFYVSGGEVTYIDFKMLLLDSGDWDGDGKGEIIFRMEKYNNDGYILFSEDRKQIIKYDWNYH